MSDHSRHRRRRTTQIPASTSHQIHGRLTHLFSGSSPAFKHSSEEEENNISSGPEEDSLSSDEDSERLQRHSTGSSFLASAARTYSRAMYAHHRAKSQPPPSPTSSLPSYTRTMHAFTLSQLNHMDNTGSHNPASLRKRSEERKRLSSSSNSKMSDSSKPIPPPIAQGPTKANARHLPTASPMPLKLPAGMPSALAQLSLKDEEPCGPSNTPELAGSALAPAPTSSAPAPSSPDLLLARGKELEAKFEELMTGMSAGDGLRIAEGRDFAQAGFV